MTEFRWYGWGYADKTYSLENRPDAWSLLRTTLGLQGDEKFPPCVFDSIRLRAPRLTEGQLRQLRNLTSPGAVKTDTKTRIAHGFGKSYRDLVRLRRGDIANPPDAVVFPAAEDQVARVIAFCVENNFALIPFGGGTNGVGGVEPRDDRVTVVLDLARMNRLIALDEKSQTATFEAGIIGPDLEHELGARGFALGHLPQSFEFSTLGGWIATRGAGAASTKYGTIETLTHCVRVVTPRGVLQTTRAQWIAGSEGTLGVITQATLRIHRLPKTTDCRALLFKTFADGIEAIRAMAQSGVAPAIVNLSDVDETRVLRAFSLREASSGWNAFTETIRLQMMSMLGYSIENGALLILGFEDDPRAGEGRAICKAHGAFDLGRDIANAWLRDRCEMPYLRDALLDRGILMGTFETATTWNGLPTLYQKLGQAIAEAARSQNTPALVMAHIAHGSRESASLEITFFVRMLPGNEIAQWEAIQRAAFECVVTNGGTLSPHSGVGYEHAAWVERDALSMAVLTAVKTELDPDNVMNPGKWLKPKVVDKQEPGTEERYWNLPKLKD